MTRTAAILIAFSAAIGTALAAPAHRQPTPASVGTGALPASPPAATAPSQRADKAARETADAAKRDEATRVANEAARAAGAKKWDTQMKRTMGGVCSGC